MKNFRLIWPAAKNSFKGFSDHKVTKLSASLAYYTVFSLGPLLVVIIFLCSLFLGQEAVQGTIYNQLQAFIGKDAAAQVETIIKNAAVSGKGGIAAVIGIVTLMIGATSVFSELQDSMNSIWGVKAKPKAGITKIISNRLLSFGLIASLGFLLLVSLAVTAVVEGLGHRLKTVLPGTAVILLYIVNLIITIGVVTALFAIIFKVLPDVKLKWKHVWPGAIATCLLFLLGKFAISLYISKSNIGSTYGSAGSLVVLLLWIYYSAIILYLGAEFTKAYALQKGAKIHPAQLAKWDEKPAIAGATAPNSQKEHEQQNENTPTQKSTEKYHPPLLPVSVSTGKASFTIIPPQEKNKKPGIATVLLGLALYFVTSPKKQQVSRG